MTDPTLDAIRLDIEEQSKRAECCAEVTIPGEKWRKFLADIRALLDRLADVETLKDEREQLLDVTAKIIGVESHWVNLDKQATKVMAQLAAMEAGVRKLEGKYGV